MRCLRHAVVFVLVLPTLALAQAPAPTAAAAVEQRITSLKARLGITPDEQPLWDTFAQVMRDNTAATDALFTQRASDAKSMNAVDNMHSYAEIVRAYADSTEKLSAAFDNLYAGLSDTQKRTADTLFREQTTPHR
jgi:hypothetical protein